MTFGRTELFPWQYVEAIRAEEPREGTPSDSEEVEEYESEDEAPGDRKEPQDASVEVEGTSASQVESVFSVVSVSTPVAVAIARHPRQDDGSHECARKSCHGSGEACAAAEKVSRQAGHTESGSTAGEQGQAGPTGEGGQGWVLVSGMYINAPARC